MITFAYKALLYGGIVTLCIAALYRWRFFKISFYTYPLTQVLLLQGYGAKLPYRKILNGLRFIVLLGLVFLIARPQLVDQQSKVQVEGVDIMLALDVSGSMQLFDSLQDQRRRIDVAKKEAIAFMKKRHDDPIGLVLFGNEAVSRCPLTLDKKMLEAIIDEVELGMINAEGTMLIRGVIMALNRMRKSEARSKVIILLTDGEPTPGDLDPMVALELAKKYGVKIYTIGIGGDQGGYYEHPLFGVQQARVPLNKRLLQGLAQETGGKFFQAKDPADLATIYDTINTLEKTSYETNIYQRYYDIFKPYVVGLIALSVLECVLSKYIWFGLGL